MMMAIQALQDEVQSIGLSIFILCIQDLLDDGDEEHEIGSWRLTEEVDTRTFDVFVVVDDKAVSFVYKWSSHHEEEDSNPYTQTQGPSSPDTEAVKNKETIPEYHIIIYIANGI